MLNFAWHGVVRSGILYLYNTCFKIKAHDQDPARLGLGGGSRVKSGYGCANRDKNFDPILIPNSLKIDPSLYQIQESTVGYHPFYIYFVYQLQDFSHISHI